MVPNYIQHVEAARQKYPEAWRVAHTGGSGTEAFIRLLAADLHAFDKRCGLNGKRGDPTDISDDVIAFRGEGSAVDVINGGPMEIVDVIAGAGGPNPQPSWNVAPGGPGDKGTWVAPASTIPPPVTQCPDPARHSKPDCPNPAAHQPQPPPSVPYAGDAASNQILGVILADYQQAQQAYNAEGGLWFGRTLHDAENGLGVQKAIEKHRPVWMAALGLP